MTNGGLFGSAKVNELANVVNCQMIDEERCPVSVSSAFAFQEDDRAFLVCPITKAYT